MTDPLVEFDAGVTNDGQPVRGFCLESVSGLRVMLLSYGAHMASVEVPGRGPDVRAKITDGPSTVTDLEHPRAWYQGATIGRYANRIANARFVLDGVPYELPANQGRHHLHGGPNGFTFRVWDAEPLVDAAPGVGVRFELSSPAGDNGYPGAVRAEAFFRLIEQRLELEYSAVTDAPTPIALTNHTYWNLSGDHGPLATVSDHTLTVHSDRVLIPDAEGIPRVGPPVPVAGTRFALHESPLGQLIESGGVDHCFVNPAADPLDPERETVPKASASGLHTMIELCHASSGRSLRVETDQPGVQVYTGIHMDPPGRSIAFEPQAWPNSPNRPDFPSAVLRPGERYRHRTVYHFGW